MPRLGDAQGLTLFKFIGSRWAFISVIGMHHTAYRYQGGCEVHPSGREFLDWTVGRTYAGYGPTCRSSSRTSVLDRGGPTRCSLGLLRPALGMLRGCFWAGLGPKPGINGPSFPTAVHAWLLQANPERFSEIGPASGSTRNQLEVPRTLVHTVLMSRLCLGLAA